MPDQSPPGRVEHSNSYNIFILVLTVMSLTIMALLILPLPDAGPPGPAGLRQPRLPRVPRRLRDEPGRGAPKRDYFIGQRGWLDLLGSIPSLGLVTVTGNAVALFRLARLSRLARITRLLRGQAGKDLVLDVLKNRASTRPSSRSWRRSSCSSTSSVLVLEFEANAPDANITTGGDALWWAVVTITTVGYGDYVSRHDARPLHRRLRHVRRRRDHRCAGQHPRQCPRSARSTSARDRTLRLEPRPPATPAPIPTSTIEAELAGLRAEMAASGLALAPEPPAAPG